MDSELEMKRGGSHRHLFTILLGEQSLAPAIAASARRGEVIPKPLVHRSVVRRLLGAANGIYTWKGLSSRVLRRCSLELREPDAATMEG